MKTSSRSHLYVPATLFVYFDQVEDINIGNNDNVAAEDLTEEVLHVESSRFHEAKLAELLSWKENHVYDEVEYRNQSTMSVRWILTFKNTESGIIPKVRLVARGFEEENENIITESPLCSRDALRILTAITAQRSWKLNTIDIKTAFLQGEKIEKDIYLVPPKEANTDKVWKLRKCVRSLISDASLKWYDRAKMFMVKEGLKVSIADPAVFYKYNNGSLEGFLAVHVDDFYWLLTFITPNILKRVVSRLKSTFKVGKEKSKDFTYVGLSANQDKHGITLDNISYIHVSSLKKIQVPSDSKEDCLNMKDSDSLRSKLGQLLWISGQTRPDVSFHTCHLATRLKDGKVKDIIFANKVIRSLQTETVQLRY